MSVEEYDLVILGGGTGSTVAAWTFAAAGQRVAVVERRYIGGSCPNIACLPSKNIIHSAQIASYVRRSAEFGVPKKEFTVNMHAIRERKRSMVSGWNAVYLDNYKKSGAEFVLGSGRFIGPGTLEVTLPEGATSAFGKRAAIIIRELQIFWRISIRVFQHRPVERSHAHECTRQMKGLK
jgi:pyruvate/2-oxoglutarate dehydrogenase complex dihydrolipoamide dehydrogenase (E3) component